MADVYKDMEFECVGSSSAAEAVEVVKRFCGTTKEYKFLLEDSETYSNGVGAPSCEVHAINTPPFPALCFSGRRGRLELCNIVCQQSGRITCEQYNDFADKFADELGRYCRENSVRYRFHRGTEELTLELILPGKQVRRAFERYLSKHPRSGHRLDLERLDFFVCTVSQYCRKWPNLDSIRQYLTTKLNWSGADADRCVNRIEIGLEVLEAKKRFR